MIANVLKVKITDLAQYSVQSKDMFIYTYNHLSKPDRFLVTLYFDKFGGAYNEGSGHG
jgi:hypothetical protein